MKDRPSAGLARRNVLQVLALGAAALTSAGCVPFAAKESEAGPTDPQDRKPRYRMTENVAAFYRVNRY